MAGVHAIAGQSGGVQVDFIAQTAYNFAYTPADALTTYKIDSSGVVMADNLTNRQWLKRGAASQFEVNAAYNFSNVGSIFSGTLGAWLALSGSPTWAVKRTINVAGMLEVLLDMQVRRVSDSVVIATFTVTIDAEVI